jgi:5-formyltetrahydrofolate cyclo-ligase
MNGQKTKIRARLLEMRRGLSSKDIEEASSVISSRVMELDVVKNAENVLMYSNFDNEIKTAVITGWMVYPWEKCLFAHGLRQGNVRGQYKKLP